jgi:hypothetical protein
MIELAEEMFLENRDRVDFSPRFLCYFFNKWDDSLKKVTESKVERLRYELQKRETFLKVGTFNGEPETIRQVEEDINLIKAELCELTK